MLTYYIMRKSHPAEPIFITHSIAKAEHVIRTFKVDNPDETYFIIDEYGQTY